VPAGSTRPATVAGRTSTATRTSRTSPSRSTGSDPPAGPRAVRPLDVAARWLARRPHTAAALETRLIEIGYRAETAARTVARCLELGWVDDARLARDRAEALRRRGAGGLKIVDDLEARGLGGSVVTAALEAASESRSERTWAERALASARIDPAGAPAKAWRFLLGRGFPEDVVADIVGEPT
jgi:SOS response regulatory protein OraA/RecX